MLGGVPSVEHQLQYVKTLPQRIGTETALPAAFAGEIVATAADENWEFQAAAIMHVARPERLTQFRNRPRLPSWDGRQNHRRRAAWAFAKRFGRLQTTSTSTGGLAARTSTRSDWIDFASK